MESNQEDMADNNLASAYNEAGLQIQRLHNLWLAAEGASIRRNHVLWNSILGAIERELYSDIMKSPKSATHLEELNKLKAEYILSLKHIKIGSMGMSTRGSNVSPCMGALDKRHKLLKGVQEDSGKGGIYRDRDNEDFVD